MISAIILAAGESRRMGVTNKLLLPISGGVLIRNFVKSVFASNVNEVVVVVGHEAKKIRMESFSQESTPYFTLILKPKGWKMWKVIPMNIRVWVRPIFLKCVVSLIVKKVRFQSLQWLWVITNSCRKIFSLPNGEGEYFLPSHLFNNPPCFHLKKNDLSKSPSLLEFKD